MGYLILAKLAAFDPSGGVDLDDVVFDLDFKDVQCPRGRRINHVAADVENRSMARANESLLVCVPGNGAAQVGAFAMDAQESAVLQAIAS